MLALGVEQVVLHQLVHCIHAAGKRLGKASPAYYGVEAELYSGVFEPLHYEVPAVLVLVADVLELRQFAYMMVCTGHPYGLFVFIDGYFRRRGTGVYD